MKTGCWLLLECTRHCSSPARATSDEPLPPPWCQGKQRVWGGRTSRLGAVSLQEMEPSYPSPATFLHCIESPENEAGHGLAPLVSTKTKPHANMMPIDIKSTLNLDLDELAHITPKAIVHPPLPSPIRSAALSKEEGRAPETSRQVSSERWREKRNRGAGKGLLDLITLTCYLCLSSKDSSSVKSSEMIK